MTEDVSKASISRSKIEALLREAVGESLSLGAEPSEVSFVMAVLSTELGLFVTENNLSVIPVVLSGIAWAIQNCKEPDESTQESTAQYETSTGQVIH